MPSIQFAYENENSDKLYVEKLEGMHELFASKKRVARELICGSCEEAVIARRGIGKKHFAHRNGCGDGCDWVSERLRTRGFVSSCIHQGKQKGKLHQKIQKEFFEALSFSGYDVKTPDSYFNLYDGEKPGRYPDIHVTSGNMEVIFEIQIRPIQVPDIKERTAFYEHRHTQLFWVLNEIDFERLRSFQWDVIAAQGGVAYSVDIITRNLTRERKELCVRAAYLNFDVSMHGCLRLIWKDEIETFEDLTNSSEVIAKQKLAKLYVENCDSLNLSEFKPKGLTLNYLPNNFATLEQSANFQRYLNRLIEFKKGDSSSEFLASYKKALVRIAELLKEDQDLVLGLASDDRFFKALCTFMSFSEGQIKYYNFANFKELLNHFISNKFHHRWLPILLPTILMSADFPIGFKKHLHEAINFVDTDQKYTSLTSRIILFFMPSLLSTNL